MKRRWLLYALGIGVLLWWLAARAQARVNNQSPPPLAQARTSYDPARIWG